DGVRQCFMPLESHRIQNLSELVAALKLTPRQIQECFRVLGHILSTETDKRGKLLWCLSVASIAMSAFRIGKPEIFQQLGNQCLTPNDAILLLRGDLKLKDVEWWFTLFATGHGILFKEGQNVIDVLKEAGLMSNDSDSVPGYFSQWYQGWGHSSENRFAQTHQRIEHIMQW
ncbi:MAG TPA: hypothetical protein VF258_03965, partial [Luteolibacter sp.]